ncbi:hypothetical protein HHI36_023941 [Cryptolaemus montrouzieri]|uniref:Uncharacterized protein n=1 Tax=Cryptolaemus montrouzieri TaxID=559131 RepID=A0ABD2N167_9CUCU
MERLSLPKNKKYIQPEGQRKNSSIAEEKTGKKKKELFDTISNSASNESNLEAVAVIDSKEKSRNDQCLKGKIEFCIFCKEYRTQLARHLFIMYKDEVGVKNFMHLEPRDFLLLISRFPL